MPGDLTQQVYPGFEILKKIIGDKPALRSKENWEKRLKKWAQYKTRGKCCFCLAETEVYDVIDGMDAINFENFTDLHLSCDPGFYICSECLAVLKDNKFMNQSLLYILTLSSEIERGENLKIKADNFNIFEQNAEGRRLFLNRLLDGLPGEPFICGWKCEKTHAVPFSPLNEPGAGVVQVLYQGAKTFKPGVIFFDRIRYRKLVEEAVLYWDYVQKGHKYQSDLLGAYKGSTLLDFVLRLTCPIKTKNGSNQN